MVVGLFLVLFLDGRWGIARLFLVNFASLVSLIVIRLLVRLPMRGHLTIESLYSLISLSDLLAGSIWLVH